MLHLTVKKCHKMSQVTVTVTQSCITKNIIKGSGIIVLYYMLIAYSIHISLR